MDFIANLPLREFVNTPSGDRASTEGPGKNSPGKEDGFISFNDKLTSIVNREKIIKVNDERDSNLAKVLFGMIHYGNLPIQSKIFTRINPGNDELSGNVNPFSKLISMLSPESPLSDLIAAKGQKQGQLTNNITPSSLKIEELIQEMGLSTKEKTDILAKLDQSSAKQLISSLVSRLNQEKTAMGEGENKITSPSSREINPESPLSDLMAAKGQKQGQPIAAVSFNAYADKIEKPAKIDIIPDDKREVPYSLLEAGKKGFKLLNKADLGEMDGKTYLGDDKTFIAEFNDKTQLRETSENVFDRLAVKNAVKDTGAGEIIEQIAVKLKIHHKNDHNRILINLDPPSLGKLRINLIQRADTLQAFIVVESSLVKDMIESHLNQLRQSLQDQGLKVSQFFIDVNSEGTGGETFQRENSFANEETKNSMQANGEVSSGEEENQSDLAKQVKEDGTVDFFA